jgi:hypothetical protein
MCPNCDVEGKLLISLLSLVMNDRTSSNTTMFPMSVVGSREYLVTSDSAMPYRHVRAQYVHRTVVYIFV